MRTFLIVHHDGRFYRETYVGACNMMRAYRKFKSWHVGRAVTMREFGVLPATLYVRGPHGGWMASPRTPF